MLKNNEPYRYAQPKRIQTKFSAIRRRVAGTTTATKAGKRPRSLPDVYIAHGLPAVTPLDQLAPGERRVLDETGVRPAVESMYTG